MTKTKLCLSVTERLVLSALEDAFENKLEIDHVILNKKYGSMAYDLFTPDCYLETPGGRIDVSEEEKKDCWKTSQSFSKFMLKDKWTKEDAIAYYKCALLCRIAKNAVFHGWEFKILVPENRSADSFISVQFYERKYRDKIELLCKDKQKLKELCT